MFRGDVVFIVFDFTSMKSGVQEKERKRGERRNVVFIVADSTCMKKEHR